MSSLRGRLKSLQRALEPDMISIPQTDGTAKRFPAAEGLDAFLVGMSRIRAAHLGEDVPPAHPLSEAASNSSDPKFRESFFAIGLEGKPGQDPSHS
jgi:hypothetical protein